jgi:high-affinity iron transporter
VTRGVARRGIFIAGGVVVGVVGAALLAGFAGVLSDSLAGHGQEVFNAAIQAVVGGIKSLVAMAIVVAIAVLRECAEVVLFPYVIAAASTEGWTALLLGGMLGVALGAAVSFLLHLGLLAIPLPCTRTTWRSSPTIRSASRWRR